MSESTVSSQQLRAFIERIENLNDDKKSIQEDIKDVYAEAKGNGFDTKVMRMIVKLRSMDRNELREQEAILDLYKNTLGMQ